MESLHRDFRKFLSVVGKIGFIYVEQRQDNSAGGERIPTLVKVAYEPMSPSPMSH